MNLVRNAFLLITVSAFLTSCSSTPRHRAQQELLAGNVHPVEVFVPLEENETATGKVYYRLKGSDAFQQTELTKAGRGERLFADIPTRDMKPGEMLEYHITVMKGAQPFYLKSHSEPYRVHVLSKEDLIAKTLSANATYTHAGENISFTFNAGSYDARHVKIMYQLPGITGTTTTDMNRYSAGTWKLVIPGSFVHPGIWMYRVEATIGDVVYRLPESGFFSFQVKPKTSPQ